MVVRDRLRRIILCELREGDVRRCVLFIVESTHLIRASRICPSDSPTFGPFVIIFRGRTPPSGTPPRQYSRYAKLSVVWLTTHAPASRSERSRSLMKRLNPRGRNTSEFARCFARFAPGIVTLIERAARRFIYSRKNVHAVPEAELGAKIKSLE